MTSLVRLRRLAVLALGGCAFTALLCQSDSSAAERMLVVGDSNATGVGVPASKAWPMRLMRMLNAPVQVFGAPGGALATPYMALSEYPQCPRRIAGIYGVTWAVLALGTNDSAAGVPLDAMRAGVTKVLNSTPAQWVCLTPPSRGNEATFRTPAGDSLADYREAIAEACAAAGAIVLDGATVVPPRYLLGDGVHVSVAGHMRIAHAVARALSR